MWVHPSLNINIHAHRIRGFDEMTKSSVFTCAKKNGWHEVTQLLTDGYGVDESTPPTPSFISPKQSVLSYIFSKIDEPNSPWAHLKPVFLSYSARLFAMTVLLCDDYLVLKKRGNSRREKDPAFFRNEPEVTDGTANAAGQSCLCFGKK